MLLEEEPLPPASSPLANRIRVLINTTCYLEDMFGRVPEHYYTELSDIEI